MLEVGRMIEVAAGQKIEEWAAGELPFTWKTAGRGWGHPLHKLAPYVGGFPAQLARFFILNLSDRGQTVFDPWCGGGTTLLEALLCDRNAIGSDAFEYAYVLSHAKGAAMPLDDFERYLRGKLDEANRVDNSNWRLLDDPATRIFFSDPTLDAILRLREVVAEDESREALFLKAVMAGVLHGPSTMFLSAPQKDQVSSTPQYVKRYLERHGIERPVRDVFASAMNKAGRSLLTHLPARRARVFRGDSRTVPLEDGSVDLIVTSPPYLSVLDYSWNNWLRLWWLRKDRLTERGKLILTGREDLYRHFIRNSLSELYRVLAPDSAAVIVVGDVRQGRNGTTTILNSALLIAQEALPLGFDIECVIDDIYRLNARPMLVLNMLKWGYTEDDHIDKSSVLIDRCLVLRKGRVHWRWPRVDWEAMRQRRTFLIDDAPPAQLRLQF